MKEASIATLVVIGLFLANYFAKRTPEQDFIDACSEYHTLPGCYAEWERRHEHDPYPP